MSQNKRIIALDVGTKTCGIATTDPLGIICQPLTTLNFKGQHDYKRVFQNLEALFVEKKPSVVVVGLPLHRDGSESDQAGIIRDFIKGFQKHLTKKQFDINEIEWVFFDEYRTSQIAEEFLIDVDVSRQKRKKVIDKMAAYVILQSYLSSISPNHI